jgi:hypothetical protein
VESMSSEMQELVRLVRHIARTLDRAMGEKPHKTPKQNNDERTALAVVAISQGASTFTEIAN